MFWDSGAPRARSKRSPATGATPGRFAACRGAYTQRARCPARSGRQTPPMPARQDRQPFPNRAGFRRFRWRTRACPTAHFSTRPVRSASARPGPARTIGSPLRGGKRPFTRRGPNDEPAPKIGIGGHLAVPPLPHHRAYGSRTRRFDRVKLGQEHRGGGDRGRRSTDCAAPVGRPDVLTCARTRSASRQQPPRGTSARHGAAAP